MTDAAMATKPTTQSLRAGLAEHDRHLNDRLQQVSRFMTVRRFRILKIVLAFSLVVFGIFGIWRGGDPTLIVSLTVPTAGALAGLEMVDLLSTYLDGVQAQQDHSDD